MPKIFTCAISGEHFSSVEDMHFFNSEGEKVTHKDSYEMSVHETGFDLIEQYNEHTNIFYLWDDLSEGEQKALIPYIQIANRNNQMEELFVRASEIQEEDGFEGYLKMLHEICQQSKLL